MEEMQDFVFKSNSDHTILSSHFMWGIEFFKRWPNKRQLIYNSFQMNLKLKVISCFTFSIKILFEKGGKKKTPQ